MMTSRLITRGGAGLLLAGLACCLTAPAAARDRVWLIGGGPALRDSQAQIEQNVLWAREVLTALPGERTLKTYFTDGDDPGKDIKVWAPPADRAATLQPLARLYDAYISNGDHYRNHRLTGVAGPASAAYLAEALPGEFATLQPDEQGLLIFNGHGIQGEAGPQDNALALWDDSALRVGELSRLMARADPRATLRFVLTQCYSGGFARLAYDDIDALRLAPAPRCGFMAVAEDRPSEGCSAGVDANDYRDYSTYFFAALHGRARTGDALRRAPDRDRDGRVTLYEAHLYSLETARSTDLPRSTSEDFLLRWAPWYLRWWAPEAAPDDPYGPMAERLAAALAVTPEGVSPELVLRRRQRQLDQDIRALRDRQYALREQIAARRHTLRQALERRWPEAAIPYTLAYARFLQQDLAPAQAFILDHPDYPLLAADQDRYWELDDSLLELERQQARLDKLRHLWRLSRARAALAQLGNADDQAAYRRLLACEDQPL